MKRSDSNSIKTLSKFCNSLRPLTPGKRKGEKRFQNYVDLRDGEVFLVEDDLPLFFCHYITQNSEDSKERYICVCMCVCM